MKSTKHLPVIVFVMGLSMLLYSMYVFFSSRNAVAPIVVETTPSEPIPVPQSERAPLVMRSSAIDREPEPSDTIAADLRKAARAPAEKYLKDVGLEMSIPDDVLFEARIEKGVRILIGSTAPGHNGFYMFTRKGKTPPAKAIPYLKTFLGEQHDLRPSGDAQEYFNRGGFDDMKLFKGLFASGEEYQVYAFHNPVAKSSHIVLLAEKQLGRQPARVRALIDSMKTTGTRPKVQTPKKSKKKR